jgi:5-methylcytosine-specific restriction endonuclease McrA
MGKFMMRVYSMAQSRFGARDVSPVEGQINSREPSILALDSSGLPRRWINLEDAAAYYCRGAVAWDLGEHAFTLRGGLNRVSGEQSRLVLRSIVAVRGERGRNRGVAQSPVLLRDMLFARDRMLCAYCGGRFRAPDLTAEHVMPQSRGGANRWTNLVSACRPCNHKGNRTPEEAGMALLYVPYTPSLHEGFILRNRRILADQMAFLMAGVPPHSRLHGAKPAPSSALQTLA